MKVTIVFASDWEAIYVDGNCLWQHHHIEEYGWVRLHNQYPNVEWTEVFLTEAGYEWLVQDGHLPYRFEEIPPEYLSS